MKKKLILWMMILATSTGFAEKVGVINGLIRPFMISISAEDMFVVDGTTVFKYNLANLKLIKKFGKKGEGPGEFFVPPGTNMGNVTIQVLPDSIVVTSLSKRSIFTRDGVFVREIRSTFPWPDYATLGDKIVGRGSRVTKGIRYYTVKLFDRDSNRGKEICSTQGWINRGVAVIPFYMIGPSYYVFANEVYVEKDKDEILCFNRDGRMVRRIDIRQGYGKIRVSRADRQKYLEYFKTEPAFKDLYPRIRPYVKFPAYYPGIKFFFLADGEIYIIRWTGSKDLTDMAVFSPQGKLVCRGSIRVFMKDAIMPHCFGFSKRKFYQLVESQEEEGEWELHRTEIR